MRTFLKRVGLVILLVAALPFVLTLAYRSVDPISTLMLWDRLRARPVAHEWVPLDRIAPSVVRAVISSEDANFCRHHGIDWAAVDQAVELAERTGRRPRGVSTITMQVVKNLFLWPQRSYVRKVIEAPIALWMDLVLPKRRILEIYLNVAEWGPSTYGIEAGARRAFGKSAADLGPREAAVMATSLPNPILRDAKEPGRRQLRLVSVIERRARSADPYLGCLR